MAPDHKEFSIPTKGAIKLAINATYLELEVTADPYTTRATAKVTGPDDVLSKIREEARGDTWALRWPRTPGAGRGGIQINSFGVGTMISGGSVYVGSGRGRVVVDGVDVTDMVRAAAPGPVRAVVSVPAGSSLDLRIEQGDITTRGTLGALSADTTSADVNAGLVASLRVRSVSGDVAAEAVSGITNVHTVSGDVEVGAAAGAVSTNTTSGDVRVHATQSITVDAGSVSGDIRVTANPGVRPDVRGRSVSGRVRTQ